LLLTYEIVVGASAGGLAVTVNCRLPPSTMVASPIE
jgi:hypothetical protein